MAAIAHASVRINADTVSSGAAPPRTEQLPEAESNHIPTSVGEQTTVNTGRDTESRIIEKSSLRACQRPIIVAQFPVKAMSTIANRELALLMCENAVAFLLKKTTESPTNLCLLSGTGFTVKQKRTFFRTDFVWIKIPFLRQAT